MSNTITNIIQAHVPCLIPYISVLEIAYHSVYYRVLLMVKGNTADKAKERLLVYMSLLYFYFSTSLYTDRRKQKP